MLSIWDSFGDLPRIQRELEKSVFGGGRARERASEFAPAVDVHEDNDAVSLSAELPGVKREDMDIQVDGNVLTLRGERKFESEQTEGRRFHLIERSYGKFSRQFHLSSNLDATKIDAQLADGVLTVRLPKKQEQKPRKIEVRGREPGAPGAPSAPSGPAS
jgi:HSP20 family protein